MKKLVLFLGIVATVPLYAGEELHMVNEQSDDFTDVPCDFIKNTLPSKIEIKGGLTSAQKEKRNRLIEHELAALRKLEDILKALWSDDGSVLIKQDDFKALASIKQRIVILETGQEDAFRKYLRYLRKKKLDTFALKNPSFQQFLTMRKECSEQSV